MEKSTACYLFVRNDGSKNRPVLAVPAYGWTEQCIDHAVKNWCGLSDDAPWPGNVDAIQMRQTITYDQAEQWLITNGYWSAGYDTPITYA